MTKSNRDIMFLNKAHKVIDSCTTFAQLAVAKKYLELGCAMSGHWYHYQIRYEEIKEQKQAEYRSLLITG